jgi:hypothetical protein
VAFTPVIRPERSWGAAGLPTPSVIQSWIGKFFGTFLGSFLGTEELVGFGDRSSWDLPRQPVAPVKARDDQLLRAPDQTSIAAAMTSSQPWWPAPAELSTALDPANPDGRPEAWQSGDMAFTCPVCGAEELSTQPYETWPPPDDVSLVPPYEDQLGRPSYEVCPNCGFEFGNDDNPGTAPPQSFDGYRRDWSARGSPRFSAR